MHKEFAQFRSASIIFGFEPSRYIVTFSCGVAMMSPYRLFYFPALLIVAAPGLTKGFFVHHSPTTQGPPLCSTTRSHGRLWSTTENEMDAAASLLNGDADAAETSQQVARAALEKLRARQRSELEETDRLLELVNAEVDLTVASTPTSLSTAASLLSGVDYGFIGRSDGVPATLQGGLEKLANMYPGPPPNLWTLGTTQFVRNLKAILGEYSDEPEVHLTPQQVELQEKLNRLTLNSTQIWEREEALGPIRAPWIIKLPYLAVCYLLDVVFEHRYVPSRFFLLETVARMPYFSYIGMLHVYETFGFWRRSADMKRIHFAEELNEYRHLLIMESLGGDQAWWVRFVAQHSALVYFFVLCTLFAISPTLSYKFSEMLETHAVITYTVFCENNEELLKELPPSNAAVEYYSLGTSDPFYAEFQTAALVSGHEIRRPGEQMRNLHDVFQAIAADEGDHVSAMNACLDPQANLQSPSLERRAVTGIALVAAATYLATTATFIDPALIDPSLLDGGTLADLAGAADGMTIVEALAAGAAAFGQKVLEDAEFRDAVDLGLDAVEGGAALTAMEQLRKFAAEVVEFFARVL